MAKIHRDSVTMIDPAVVAFTNDAFYLAFNNQDLEAMDRLWVRRTPPVCIHPGWSPMFDREEIMQSWRDIFSQNEVQPDITCHFPTVLFQHDINSVICFEQLPKGWLVATNIFVMEDGELRIFHHQASQCMNPPDLTEEKSQTLQ